MADTTEIQEFAREFAQYTNRNIFLTGKAGTGKTTFLHHLRKITGKQMAVVAPTGVAAINAGGATIHSFFQLPFTPFLPTTEGKKDLTGKLKMQSYRRNVIRELELLVIDEISMVRADVLDAIDTVLRHVRYRHNEPFGGVQMIFIGDMYQLSPVAQEEEYRILSRFYEGIYFFHSQVFQSSPFIHIEFEKIFRQQDIHFITLLNEVRNNCLSENSFTLLQQQYKPSFTPKKDDSYIILTTHNYKAEKINSEELADLKGKSCIFKARVERDFPEKSFPVDENLELKVGAKVMFIKNDTETPRRFFNGKIGKITALEEDIILVKCPADEEEIEVKPMVWHNIRYKTDEATLQVEEEILGTFTQFPLRLAWAITIHKSQGLTFEKAVIDAGASFAPGQVYVALSRCKTLEGMVLNSQINRSILQNDEQIVRFSAKIHSAEELDSQLKSSKQNYYNTLLISIFDFKKLLNSAVHWRNELKEIKTSFNEETPDFVEDIVNPITDIQDVGLKFQHQLTHICSAAPFNNELLLNRLKASSEYFTDKLEDLIESLKQSPAVTDSRQNAKIYDEGLYDIYTLAGQKKHQIKGTKDGFSVDKYFQLKNTLELPLFSKTSYSKHTIKQKSESKHPKLLYQLFQIRNAICDETKQPVYLVAGSQTLQEMADFLPQNEKDMLRMYGFGQIKYEKYGERFLKCITDYCSENGLSSAMAELFEKNKPKERNPNCRKENQEELRFKVIWTE